MNLFTEELYDELESIVSQSEKMLALALHLAAQGVRVFPAVEFKQELYDEAYQEHLDELTKPKGEQTEAIAKRDYYTRYGGKRPAAGLGNQYKTATINEEKIRSWWDKGGAYRGNNVCIATGKESGVVVLDIDNKPGEPNGFDWWDEALKGGKERQGETETMVVRSGGERKGDGLDGRHMYFLWREGTNMKNDIAKGVDWRGDGGHIVAPLSRCQNTYEVVRHGPLVPVPDWLLDVVSGKDKYKDKAAPKGAKPFEFVEEDVAPVYPPLHLDDVKEALEYLDPAEMSGKQWMNMFYAIHSEHPTDEAYVVLDEWSKRDEDRYDSANNIGMWKRAQVDKVGGVTMGTLTGAAMEAGWHNPSHGYTLVGMSQAIRMMNRSFSSINGSLAMQKSHLKGRKMDFRAHPPGEFVEGTIFRRAAVLTDREDIPVPKYSSKGQVSDATVDKMVARYRVLVKNPGGRSTLIKLRDAWEQSEAANAYVTAGFYIKDERTPEGVHNLFPGWMVQPKEGVPAKFLEHVLDVLCSGKKEQYFWVMNRLAYMVQFGDKICSTVLVLGGRHGAGKSIFGTYVGAMIGSKSYMNMIDPEPIVTKFSAPLVGKFLVVADEAIFAGNNEIRTKIKGITAAETIRSEEKYQTAMTVQNVMFLMIFSNETTPVGVEDGDRRFTVTSCSDKYSKKMRDTDPEIEKMASAHFNDLVEEMNGDGPSNLLDMLLNWRVDAELARQSLNTDEKQAMAEDRVMSTDSLTAFAYYIYSESGDDGADKEGVDGAKWEARVKTTPLRNEYLEWFKKEKDSHRNSNWKPEPSFKFSPRLVEEFGFTKGSSNGVSCLTYPPKELLGKILDKVIPETMKKHNLQPKEAK